MSVQTEKQDPDKEKDKKTTVKVKATYQPTTAKFNEKYARETTLAPVKVDVMGFFQVTERTQGRSVYTYHLFFQGQPLNDLGKTLGSLGGDEHEVDFQLVEQIVES